MLVPTYLLLTTARWPATLQPKPQPPLAAGLLRPTLARCPGRRRDARCQVCAETTATAGCSHRTSSRRRASDGPSISSVARLPDRTRLVRPLPLLRVFLWPRGAGPSLIREEVRKQANTVTHLTILSQLLFLLSLISVGWSVRVTVPVRTFSRSGRDPGAGPEHRARCSRARWHRG